MRKLLLSSVVFAAVSSVTLGADLPSITKGPPDFVAQGVNWEGFYVGLNYGAGWGTTDWSSPTGLLLLGSTPSFPASGNEVGILGGATLGYNHQMGPWVIGLEGDIDATSLYGNAVCGGIRGVFSIGWACKTRTDLLASLDARAGYAVGNALFFGKAGLAYAHDKFGISAFNPGGFLNPDPSISASQNRFGFNAGAGIEYALGGGWSAKAEYDYYGFGNGSVSGFDPGFGTSYGANASHNISVAKFGLNYRWGSGAETSAPVPVVASDISGEFGARTGWTTGGYRFNLFDPIVTSQMNSRLTWPGSGLMAEGFGRVDLVKSVFVKGFIGGTSLFNGTMHDEDFPPAIVPYSNTVSNTKNGDDIYGTLDLGYAFNGTGWRVGPFVGYNYFDDRQNAYGCTQVAAGGVCTGPGVTPPQVPANQLILSRNDVWSSVRLGVAGDMMITDRLKVAADAAWLPWTSVNGSYDNHWLRPDINPLNDHGHGSGYQLEGVLSYLVTDRLSVGLGARYWNMTAKGSTQFPGSPPSPTNYSVNRTMLFAQVSYAFGGPSAPSIRKY